MYVLTQPLSVDGRSRDARVAGEAGQHLFMSACPTSLTWMGYGRYLFSPLAVPHHGSGVQRQAGPLLEPAGLFRRRPLTAGNR